MKQLLVLGLLLRALSAAAQPFDYLTFRMINDAQHPFPFYVDARVSSPAQLSVDGVRAAAERAWGTWNAVSCAAPKAVSKGFTTGQVPNPLDSYDTSSVTPIWLLTQDADFSALLGDGLVESLTLPVSYAGVLVTCDTYLNGATKRWSLETVTPRDAYDVESVMVHEVGHCLGLGHSGSADNVMWVDLYPGDVKRQLGSSDATALCERNPVSGAEGSPCDADGTCAGSPTLKCLDQPVTQGLSLKRCSKGCTVGTGGGCALPLTCQPSSAFLGYTGACLLPGTATTQVGKACGDVSECGSAVALCRGVPTETLPSGYAFWQGGYCTQPCGAGQPECPAGSTCVNDDAQQPRCVADCRLGLADCRPGYACVELGGGAGVCWPSCYADSDCGDQSRFFCRTCDGLCMSLNDPSKQVGDVCAIDGGPCGPGQVCRALAKSGAPQVCTQQCARGCGNCPGSSTCAPIVGGELVCLKDCTTRGDCPAGLRCGDGPLGKVCVAPCVTSADCSNHQTCVGGDCVSGDAGCQVLCADIDAGSEVLPGHDGGAGHLGGTAGCGCEAADGLLGWWGVLVLFGRRSWRRG